MSEPLCQWNLEDLKLLAAAVAANHKWHKTYDDYGGYEESDLCELNMKAIGVAKSIGLLEARITP